MTASMSWVAVRSNDLRNKEDFSWVNIPAEMKAVLDVLDMIDWLQ